MIFDENEYYKKLSSLLNAQNLKTAADNKKPVKIDESKYEAKEGDFLDFKKYNFVTNSIISTAAKKENSIPSIYELFEQAHPKSVHVGESDFEGGLVENIFEQQQIALQNIKKFPNGFAENPIVDLVLKVQKEAKNLRILGMNKEAAQLNLAAKLLKKKLNKKAENTNELQAIYTLLTTAKRGLGSDSSQEISDGIAALSIALQRINDLPPDALLMPQSTNIKSLLEESITLAGKNGLGKEDIFKHLDDDDDVEKTAIWEKAKEIINKPTATVNHQNDTSSSAINLDNFPDLIEDKQQERDTVKNGPPPATHTGVTGNNKPGTNSNIINNNNTGTNSGIHNSNSGSVSGFNNSSFSDADSILGQNSTNKTNGGGNNLPGTSDSKTNGAGSNQPSTGDSKKNDGSKQPDTSDSKTNGAGSNQPSTGDSKKNDGSKQPDTSDSKGGWFAAAFTSAAALLTKLKGMIKGAFASVCNWQWIKTLGARIPFLSGIGGASAAAGGAIVVGALILLIGSYYMFSASRVEEAAEDFEEFIEQLTDLRDNNTGWLDNVGMFGMNVKDNEDYKAIKQLTSKNISSLSAEDLKKINQFTNIEDQDLKEAILSEKLLIQGKLLQKYFEEYSGLIKKINILKIKTPKSLTQQDAQDMVNLSAKIQNSINKITEQKKSFYANLKDLDESTWVDFDIRSAKSTFEDIIFHLEATALNASKSNEMADEIANKINEGGYADKITFPDANNPDTNADGTKQDASNQPEVTTPQQTAAQTQQTIMTVQRQLLGTVFGLNANVKVNGQADQATMLALTNLTDTLRSTLGITGNTRLLNPRMIIESPNAPKVIEYLISTYKNPSAFLSEFQQLSQKQ